MREALAVGTRTRLQCVINHDECSARNNVTQFTSSLGWNLVLGSIYRTTQGVVRRPSKTKSGRVWSLHTASRDEYMELSTRGMRTAVLWNQIRNNLKIRNSAARGLRLQWVALFIPPSHSLGRFCCMRRCSILLKYEMLAEHMVTVVH